MNRFVLMITDSKQTYNINLPAVFRQIAVYFLIFIFCVIVFAIVSISVFRYELSDISTRKSLILDEYNKLLDKNSLLNEQIGQRIDELALMDSRVEDLEGTIGVPSDSENYEFVKYDLQDRVDVASLTGIQKAFVMKFIPNGYPMDYYRRISDHFGYRMHPILRVKHLHGGVDFSAEVGTPVYSTADGVVDFSRINFNSGYGNLIKIDHSFGFKTLYAHLDNVLVKRGDFVKKGQVIGYSGNSGVSTGPHLHYEIRFLGAYVDPENFMMWNMRDFDLIFQKEKNIAWQSLIKKINNLME